MIDIDFKNRRMYIIAGLVLLFSLFSLWLRLIPMFNLGSTDILNVVGSDDPLYNLRQVEQILANFPAYNWYDAMSLYPVGSTIYWGALFPEIIAFCCKIVGATTRPEIIAVGLLIPPLMGAALVPVMYLIGKMCGDWKTGLVTAGFTAIVSGQFFYRSFYGYMDHHIAEVLFATIFCLCYVYALISVKENRIDLKKIDTYKKPLLISVLTGIAFLLGLFTMPTMILFAMIVGIFTTVQFIIDVYRDRSSEYILLINGVTFSIAIVGLLIFGLIYGLKNDGINFSNYSTGHIYAYLILIGGTYFLCRLATYLKEKPKYYLPVALVTTSLIFMSVIYLISPQTYSLLIENIFTFFGQQAFSNTVQEARGWTWDSAWVTFNYGLILMFGGALVLIYNNLKDEHPHQVFVLIWSLIMCISAWQHIRYEYYLAINVALTSAVCVSFAFDRGWGDICRLASVSISNRSVPDTIDANESARKSKKRKKEKKNISRPHKYDSISIILIFLIVGLAILFVYTSTVSDYVNSSSNAIRMNGDWKESLEWMANNTPDTGVDYFTIYDKKTFTYPNQSYGVMSWWDYGHMITYIAKRIPNANPFQQGVAGSTGAAAYFMTGSEETANAIADVNGIRYVITDIEMDTGKFWAMSTWFNASVSAQPYQPQFAASDPAQPDRYQGVMFNTQDYYLTMVSRLHNFDGSMTNPQFVYYVEYTDPVISGINAPVITNAATMSSQEALNRALLYNLKAPAGYHAAAFSLAIFMPVVQVPALQHYRLVHESPNGVINGNVPNIKYVKIFEYVKGAHIKGDGIIEIPLVADTGRKFTYVQQSTNGEFIVPYSTTGTPYEVKAAGKYKIAGTDKEFDVSENAVMQGLTIN